MPWRMGMVFIMGGSIVVYTHPAAPSRAVAPMRRRRGGIAWWLIFLLGVLYFILPLYATLVFSLKAKPFLSAYTSALSDPKFIAEPRVLDDRGHRHRSSPASR